MNQTAIFLPAAVLALWTLLVLSLVPLRRFRAVAQKKASPEDFRFGESANVPADVSIPNRAWMNLLEAPILFYVACIVWFSIQRADQLVLTLAWAYVGLRIAHTLIHVTYNSVLHRLIAFALSSFTLIAIWVLLLVTLWPLAT